MWSSERVSDIVDSFCCKRVSECADRERAGIGSFGVLFCGDSARKRSPAAEEKNSVCGAVVE
jgi:hypothetical protein